MADDFAERYGDLLTGSYDCVDRIVLNAYFSIGHNPGGFRCWWRRLHGSDGQLDSTHLMRLAGRFARRVKAWAAANQVPVIYCTAGQRKRLIAGEYLEAHSVSTGIFLILVAKAPAGVWKVNRSARGALTSIEKKTGYVCHYSFHIMDPAWGPMVIKMSGHPPWPARVILDGREYVAVAAQGEGTGLTKEGSCFTGIADPPGLARVADAVSQHAAAGRLGQARDRWIYSACRCFGLDLAGQERSGFRYGYPVYPAEYSRNLLFRSGGQREDLSGRVLDRTRSRLDIPMLRTIFGLKNRPHRNRAAGPPAQEVVIDKPQYGLAWFRIRFGMLQLKACTKGEHVLRFEVTCHNAKELRGRRALDDFGEIITRLAGMADRFATTLDCADVSFLPDGLLDELPVPSQIGAVRTGGIDLNTPRIRAALAAALALAPAPPGFTAAEFATRVCQMTRHDGYTIRQAAYDPRKLRGKNLIDKPGRTRRYQVPPSAARTIAALLALRDHVIEPILAGVRSPRPGPKPARRTRIDAGYQTLRTGMQALFDDLGISMLPAAA